VAGSLPSLLTNVALSLASPGHLLVLLYYWRRVLRRSRSFLGVVSRDVGFSLASYAIPRTPWSFRLCYLFLHNLHNLTRCHLVNTEYIHEGSMQYGFWSASKGFSPYVRVRGVILFRSQVIDCNVIYVYQVKSVRCSFRVPDPEATESVSWPATGPVLLLIHAYCGGTGRYHWLSGFPEVSKRPGPKYKVCTSCYHGVSFTGRYFFGVASGLIADKS